MTQVEQGEGGRPDGRRRVIVGALVLALGLAAGAAVAAFTSGGSKQGHRVSKTTTTTTTLPPSTTSSSTPSTTTTTTTLPPSTTSTTSTTLPKPAITSFAVPATRPCPGSTSVTILWATANATGVVLSIDGPGAYKSYGPAGTDTVPFNCDGKSHTYLLATKNGSPPATMSRMVSAA